jgi:hypothetical protein
MAAWKTGVIVDWHIGGPTLGLEHRSCYVHSAQTELGRSAAWLWDLYDAQTDNN